MVPIDATGPLLPFITDDFAAGQLHQTSHSCIAQHFWRVNVYYAGQSELSLRPHQWLLLTAVQQTVAFERQNECGHSSHRAQHPRVSTVTHTWQCLLKEPL